MGKETKRKAPYAWAHADLGQVVDFLRSEIEAGRFTPAFKFDGWTPVTSPRVNYLQWGIYIYLYNYIRQIYYCELVKFQNGGNSDAHCKI